MSDTSARAISRTAASVDPSSDGSAIVPADSKPESVEDNGMATDESGLGRHGLLHRRARSKRILPTRISGAWAAFIASIILGAALVDFIVQNTRSVRVSFFSASGHVPVAVALLAAALAGAAVVLVVGVYRTAHLRLRIRRHRQ